MITIIHGDDLSSSRKQFISCKEKVKNPISLRGEKITVTDLVQILESSSLFETEKNLFIENFLSQKKANKFFKEILEYFKKHEQSSNIYFWEEKEVSKTVLTFFKTADISLFKFPQSLFLFLDNIKPNNYENVLYFHKTILKTSEELVFFMIVRQFRLMLALLLKTDSPIDEIARIAPWQRGKLERQANIFGLENIKRIYSKLYLLDYKQKYGLTSLPLVQNIDFFLMEI
ncbi:MAG: hypothetical protein V1697_02620 [Candidatus Levyibacteriota bacterium]